MLSRFAVLAALCALAFPAAAAEPEPPAALEAVSVTGTGRVMLTPDRAVFTAGVANTGPSAAEAVQENSRAMTAVIKALKGAGAKPSELRTSQLSIFPQMDYTEGREPRITGYRVSNSVTVTRDDVKGLPALLQAAVEAGANQISGVSLLVADPTRGRDQGLKDAFADARAKALVLAQAAGRSLGRALAIREGDAASAPPQPFESARAMRASADVPIEAGTDELSFSVAVTFELR